MFCVLRRVGHVLCLHMVLSLVACGISTPFFANTAQEGGSTNGESTQTSSTTGNQAQAANGNAETDGAVPTTTDPNVVADANAPASNANMPSANANATNANAVNSNTQAASNAINWDSFTYAFFGVEQVGSGANATEQLHIVLTSSPTFCQASAQTPGMALQSVVANATSASVFVPGGTQSGDYNGVGSYPQAALAVDKHALVSGSRTTCTLFASQAVTTAALTITALSPQNANTPTKMSFTLDGTVPTSTTNAQLAVQASTTKAVHYNLTASACLFFTDPAGVTYPAAPSSVSNTAPCSP